MFQSKRKFLAGETILTQRDPGASAYIIEKGRVEITVEMLNGKTQFIGTRGAGSIIGEMALVDDAPRTATVKAIEDCTLLEITQQEFKRCLDASDPVLRMTLQVILTRYRDTLMRAEINGASQEWPLPEMIERKYAKQSHAVEKIKMANEFRIAMEEGQLCLHYQPIVDLELGKISGFEALMRWIHPEKGLILPDIFIPIAEETGLIVEASKWALQESCLALKRLISRIGHDDLFMSVNFSSPDFVAESFVDTVHDIISKSGVPIKLIHLEITERLLMSQPGNARETLRMCREVGMSISIDDFGTGYSSLSYLHHFPIDTLKIDRSFISDMTENESSLALVKSIIVLAKNMKMRSIAEGVERIEEAELLAELGCDMAQGYYFAKPSPNE
jgi:EAL domain-containing protein (putative c-di-GMP-specific phosphodiesterase class I)